MADRNYLSGDYGLEPEENKSIGTAADFGKTFGAGVADIGSNIAAGSRYFYELGGSEAGADIAQGLQKIFGSTADSIRDTMNPETKKLAVATLTSEDFWAHPVLGTALKTTGMLPSVAALAIPGGLLADATAATIFAAGAGGLLNAEAGLDEFYKKLDEMKDSDLQEQSPKYRAMREMMDEKDARAKFNRDAQGWGPALNAIFGAATGMIGPAGIAARGLAGGGKGAVLGAAESGVLKRTGVAAAEGVLTNAAQEGVADLTVQNAEHEADLRREFDYAQAANKALEGGALGGLLGGAIGAVAGGPLRPRSRLKPPRPPPSRSRWCSARRTRRSTSSIRRVSRPRYPRR